MKMKGKRQDGAIDKDLQKLISDLSLTKKIDHPQYGYQVDVYVNDVSSNVVLDFLRILLCRVQSSDKPETLLRFIDELSIGDMEKMREVFGEDVPLCDWAFWKDMYIKTGRKQNGDVIIPIEKEKEKNDKKPSK